MDNFNPLKGLREWTDTMGSKRIIMFVGMGLLTACVVVHLATRQDIQAEILYTLSAMILGLGIANAVKDSKTPTDPAPTPEP